MRLKLSTHWYDAYGNIMGYWDAQGNVVAEYTYDAFGKLIASSGPMADVFISSNEGELYVFKRNK